MLSWARWPFPHWVILPATRVGRPILHGVLPTIWMAPTKPRFSKNQKQMASGSIRDATSIVAKIFRSHLHQSPFHVPQSANLLPSVKALFKAFSDMDPDTKEQAALTPHFLRCNPNPNNSHNNTTIKTILKYRNILTRQSWWLTLEMVLAKIRRCSNMATLYLWG